MIQISLENGAKLTKHDLAAAVKSHRQNIVDWLVEVHEYTFGPTIIEAMVRGCNLSLLVRFLDDDTQHIYATAVRVQNALVADMALEKGAQFLKDTALTPWAVSFQANRGWDFDAHIPSLSHKTLSKYIKLAPPINGINKLIQIATKSRAHLEQAVSKLDHLPDIEASHLVNMPEGLIIQYMKKDQAQLTQKQLADLAILNGYQALLLDLVKNGFDLASDLGVRDVWKLQTRLRKSHQNFILKTKMRLRTFALPPLTKGPN